MMNKIHAMPAVGIIIYLVLANIGCAPTNNNRDNPIFTMIAYEKALINRDIPGVRECLVPAYRPELEEGLKAYWKFLEAASRLERLVHVRLGPEISIEHSGFNEVRAPDVEPYLNNEDFCQENISIALIKHKDVYEATVNGVSRGYYLIKINGVWYVTGTEDGKVVENDQGAMRSCIAYWQYFTDWYNKMYDRIIKGESREDLGVPAPSTTPATASKPSGYNRLDKGWWP